MDAIKWVLGEQRHTSLRGKEMLDVIFSGTDQRKSLGYAEVASLVHATSRLLGARHWATAQSYSMVRRAGSEPASLSPT